MSTSVSDQRTLDTHGMDRLNMESDPCGVGLVAAISGKPSRHVVQSAIDTPASSTLAGLRT